jgi:hypothetical protein
LKTSLSPLSTFFFFAAGAPSDDDDDEDNALPTSRGRFPPDPDDLPLLLGLLVLLLLLLLEEEDDEEEDCALTAVAPFTNRSCASRASLIFFSWAALFAFSRSKARACLSAFERKPAFGTGFDIGYRVVAILQI